MGNKLWTEEDTERLIALVKSGYSGGAIAGRFGVSRSSVIGKVHRLGMHLGNSRNALSQKQAAKFRKPHQTPFNKRREFKVISKPNYQNAPIPPPNIEDIPRKAFAELSENDCRFPVNDPRLPGFGFCALPRMPGSAYCKPHHYRTHTPVPVKRPSDPGQDHAATPVKIDA